MWRFSNFKRVHYFTQKNPWLTVSGVMEGPLHQKHVLYQALTTAMGTAAHLAWCNPYRSVQGQMLCRACRAGFGESSLLCMAQNNYPKGPCSYMGYT